MLFSERSDFLRYSKKSYWAMCASFLISMLRTTNLFFGFKNNNLCRYLCRFYHECAVELIGWLILLFHQFRLVYLNKHQLVERLLANIVIIINCNVNTLKECSKMFRTCKMKCCNKTVEWQVKYLLKVNSSVIIRSSSLSFGNLF